MNEKITMHFGGGSLFLRCHKCDKDIGSREVAFPGTKDQQIQPRKELENIKNNHKCKS